jgi:predicted ABC-type ATPase
MPDVIVIAGPNGAGKSTLAPYLLRDTFGIPEYVNADTIAEGLAAFAPETVALEAGRIMLKQLRAFALLEKDFSFETTLSSRFYAKFLRQLRVNGYEFHLFFLYLQSADLAVERVRERVRLGGHNIPENVIRRRFVKGLQNFVKIYQPLADSWRFYDVSGRSPVLVAFDAGKEVQIIEEALWNQINNAIERT